MREALKVYLPLAAIALLLVILMMRFVSPPPPKAITFAAGSADGRYYALALEYQSALAEHGIEVEVLETAGTPENYALLLDSTADVALLQGGLSTPGSMEALVSLGGMFAEPFWVFARTDSEISNFEDVRTKQLAAAAPGSGTRALYQELRDEWGGAWNQPLALGGSAAARALQAGEIDVAVFAASVEASYINQLLADPEIALVPIRQAQALSMRHAALAPVILYEGVFDIGRNQPAEDTALIAAIAQLGTSKDLHPAIQSVLLEAAEGIHGGTTILNRAGSFPAADLTDLTLADEARRYFRKGPTFLRRYFSFGTANFLERAWVFLIPLLTLLLPLAQAAPPVYRWRIRRKIYVWYNDLHVLEQRGIDAKSNAERQTVLNEIRALQYEVGKVDVPVSYNDELYHLRSHINFVEALIARESARQTPG
ncbi:MAG: TAXI family TRAP transporter solute-binding subunit [Henriciella sp.]